MARFSSVGLTSVATSISFEFLLAGFQVLASLGLHVGLGRFHAALELSDFALEEMHALDGLVNLVDQPLLFEQVEIEFADQLRHFTRVRESS
jgi:hypothetical protein